MQVHRKLSYGFFSPRNHTEKLTVNSGLGDTIKATVDRVNERYDELEGVYFTVSDMGQPFDDKFPTSVSYTVQLENTPKLVDIFISLMNSMRNKPLIYGLTKMQLRHFSNGHSYLFFECYYDYYACRVVEFLKDELKVSEPITCGGDGHGCVVTMDTYKQKKKKKKLTYHSTYRLNDFIENFDKIMAKINIGDRQEFKVSSGPNKSRSEITICFPGDYIPLFKRLLSFPDVFEEIIFCQQTMDIVACLTIIYNEDMHQQLMTIIFG